MIDHALRLVADRLSQQLKAQFSVSDNLVAVAPLTDWEGKPTPETRNKLTMFLTNIEHDQLARNAQPYRQRSSVGQTQMAMPVHLDLYIMVAANFDADNYFEGIKILSAALRYFQSNPLFNRTNAPEMHGGIDQLTLELFNLRNEEIGHVWGNLGGRYLPSVLYRLRCVTIDAHAIDRDLPLIRSPDHKTTPVAEGAD